MSEEKSDASERTSLLETIDNLIYHINMERTWFNTLCLSSIIIAPLSIFFTLFILIHPFFFLIIIRRFDFAVGLIFFLYLIIVLLISILWLIVGLKEFKFISKWNERFKKYFTLKEKLDRELQKEFE